MFDHHRGIIYWSLVGCSVLSPMLYFIYYHNGDIFNYIVFPILIFLEITWITVLAAKNKRRGAKIVIAGAAGFLAFYLLFVLFFFDYLPVGPDGIYAHLTINICFLILPVSISIFLALESSFTSHLLTEKLTEVERLSQQTIEQEKEKQQILSAQKEILEKQVEERTSELSHSLKELKDTQSQLIQSEKMASLGELTAGIAHEIQNPLNFVNNFSEVNSELIDELKEEADKGNINELKIIADHIKDNEQKILQHGKRADAIVKGMLQHSRVSTGKKEPTEINKLADEYLRLSYHGMRAKDQSFTVTLKTDFDESIGKMNVVPQDIGRVLLNLFNNAFYAVMQKKNEVGDAYEPTVSVCTKKADGNIEIHVKDNGIGIPQKVIDKIFQPFFTTKPTGQGTGLGLSLAYDIVKAHGGEIIVKTNESEGAEFIITFTS